MKAKTRWFGSFLARRRWVWGVLLLAIWLRLPGLASDRSLWMDEVLSLIHSREGIGYLPRLYRDVYGASVTSALTSWVMFRLADRLAVWGSLALMRLPFVLLGLLAVWCGWRLGRAWRWWLAGLLLAVALAVWPFKVYWDTEIRFYAGTIALTVALLTAWEAYRWRPSFWRLGVALAVTAAAPLNSLQTYPLVIIPWIYVACDAAARLWRWARGGLKRRGGARDWALIATHTVLLACVSLGVVRLSRGEAWTRDQWNHARQSVQAVFAGRAKPAMRPQEAINDATKEKILADAIVLDPRTGRKRIDLTPPTAADLAAYLRDAPRCVFKPGAWSLAPLLGLAGRYPMFDELMLYDPLEESRPGDFFNVAMVICFLAGVAALAVVSPPLLLSLGALIVGVSLSLLVRDFIPNYSTRYYVTPGLAVVMICAVGFAAILSLPLRVLGRRRPRAAAHLSVFVGLGAACLLTALFHGMARRAAAYEFQRWGDLYDASVARFPEGVLFNSVSSEYFSIYNDLAIFRHDRRGSRDAWHSPRRNKVTRSAPQSLASLSSMAVLEEAADAQAVVFFDWDAGKYDLLQGLCPPLAPPTRDAYLNLKAITYNLSRFVMVSRGSLTIPLRESFVMTDTDKARRGRTLCEFDAVYETPGQYELAVARDPQNPLLRLWVDDRPVSLPRATSLVRVPQDAAVEPWRPRRAATPLRQYPLHPTIKPERDGPQVFSLDDRVTATLLAPRAPLRRQAIVLEFARPVGDRRPLIRWRCLEPRWEAVGLWFNVGKVNLWSEKGGLRLAPILKINARSPAPGELQMALVDVAEKKVIARTDLTRKLRRESGRDWAPGDQVMADAIEVNPRLAMRILDREMAVTLVLSGPVAARLRLNASRPGSATWTLEGGRQAPLMRFRLTRSGNAMGIFVYP